MSFDLLDAATGGGLVGLAGSVINKGVGYFTDKQKAKDDRESKALDYAHQKEIAALGIQTRQTEAELDEAKTQLEGSFAGLQAAIQDQTVLNGRADPIIADVLALFRPGLTVLLVGTTAVLAVIEHQPIVNSVVAMTAMAVAWWFGDRQNSKGR